MRRLMQACCAVAIMVAVAFAGDQLNSDVTMSRNGVKVASATVQGNGFFVDIAPVNPSTPGFSGAWDYGTQRYEDEEGTWYSFVYDEGSSTHGTWTSGGPGGLFE
ncbi:MAG: hypothetical protein H6831_12410 [Planctomycetes bacterium]|nr:hypothetical protein [Planctomycetota bacterium]